MKSFLTRADLSGVKVDSFSHIPHTSWWVLAFASLLQLFDKFPYKIVLGKTVLTWLGNFFFYSVCCWLTWSALDTWNRLFHSWPGDVFQKLLLSMTLHCILENLFRTEGGLSCGIWLGEKCEHVREEFIYPAVSCPFNLILTELSIHNKGHSEHNNCLSSCANVWSKCNVSMVRMCTVLPSVVWAAGLWLQLPRCLLLT